MTWERVLQEFELVVGQRQFPDERNTCGARDGSSMTRSASSIMSAPNDDPSSVSVVVASISSCSRAPAAVVIAVHIDPSGCDRTSSRLNACGL
jgi:hypothetical protein